MSLKRVYVDDQCLHDRQRGFADDDDSVARGAAGAFGAGIYGPCSFAYTSDAPGPHSSSHAVLVGDLD